MSGIGVDFGTGVALAVVFASSATWDLFSTSTGVAFAAAAGVDGVGFAAGAEGEQPVSRRPARASIAANDAGFVASPTVIHHPLELRRRTCSAAPPPCH